MSWLSDIARPEIRALQAYAHASWEPGLIRLHANESPWRTDEDPSEAGLNRYPEPHPQALMQRLAQFYGVPSGCALAGRGSDEAIDLLIRSFCRAGQDAIITTPPTFGMYSVAAHIQGAQVITVPLQRAANYRLDMAALRIALTPAVRLVFLCSPNNPTGNLLADREAVLDLARELEGRALLVVDEAYVEFSDQPSLAAEIERLPALVVLRTLSKAHGLAGARCGTLLAQSEVVQLLGKVIQPYAVTQLTIEAVFRALAPPALARTQERITLLIAERARLAAGLARLPGVERIWPSAANFLLVEFSAPVRALQRCHDAGLLVRDFSAARGLQRALRITVGAPEQNDQLLASLA
jgi:histidinol-phosphate aminotransferase